MILIKTIYFILFMQQTISKRVVWIYLC